MPFTHEKLRECIHCRKQEVFFRDSWTPFEGAIAGFLIGRAMQKGETMTVGEEL